MKNGLPITASPQFCNALSDILEFYNNWGKSGVNGSTKRGCVAVSDDDGNCLFIFKGTQEDCLEIKKLLEKRDK